MEDERTEAERLEEAQGFLHGALGDVENARWRVEEQLESGELDKEDLQVALDCLAEVQSMLEFAIAELFPPKGEGP